MDILKQDIQYLSGVGPSRKKILGEELGIFTYGDLLNNFPYKYVDRSKVYTVHELTGDMPFVQIVGKILSFETFEMGPRKERVIAHFSDGTGIMDLVWFQGGKYAKQTYKIGVEYVVFGKPTVFNNRINVTHPDMDRADTLELSSMGMQPYYSTTEKMKNCHRCQRPSQTSSQVPDTSSLATKPCDRFITPRLQKRWNRHACV